VLFDEPMPQAEPPAVFVPDGAKAYAAAIAGARLRIMDDHSFTISGGSLPPIVGRWKGVGSDDNRTFLLGLWAKTGQIDFTGWVFPMGGDGLGIQYFVQINAPRTDGGEAAAGGPLPPTSLWTVEPLRPPKSAANYPSRPSRNSGTPARVAAVPATADTQPEVMLDVLMTLKRDPFGEFVPDGAKAYETAIAGAHLRILEDGTFTIAGGSLPPVVGRWQGFRTDGNEGFITVLWAKTDQINFTGVLSTSGLVDMSIDYFVQINAPRTDGGEAAAGGSLAPTSLWILQPVDWS
jgi:hypothetical protein